MDKTIDRDFKGTVTRHMQERGLNVRNLVFELGNVVSGTTLYNWINKAASPDLRLVLDQILRTTGWQRQFWMDLADDHFPGLAEAFLSTPAARELAQAKNVTEQE